MRNWCMGQGGNLDPVAFCGWAPSRMTAARPYQQSVAKCFQAKRRMLQDPARFDAPAAYCRPGPIAPTSQADLTMA